METSELTKYREILEEERATLRHQLSDLGADPDEERLESTGFDSGFADSAQATAERAKVLATIEGLRERLGDVNHAFAKLDRGDFGRCERCGTPIAPERLEALPWARLCLACKQKAG